jgi:hypothetical protein
MAVVSLVCFFVRDGSFRVLVVAWLALNFQVLQFGLSYMGSHAMKASYGNVAGNFGLPVTVVGIVAESVWLYLLFGSILLMVWLWLDGRKTGALAKQVATGEMLKSCCPACGGHVVFPATSIGQTMPCPHCHEAMTLRPGAIKMSCFFCKGHIEFPSHAIGTKISCPHCKRDITLKELPAQ